MQTLEAIRELLDYNEWANSKMIDSLRQSPDPGAKAVRALAHLLLAEKTWLLRLQTNQDSTGFDFWQGTTLEECCAMAREVKQTFAALTDELTEDKLGSVATYKNSKGIEYSTSFRDILTHVLMHSAYHRGQVAMAVRAEGVAPAYTDYIAWVREMKGD
ncbi:MAG: DinB family protein [Blastocatellia bacterium]